MILVTTQGEECLNSDMEVIIRADENSVKLETGGGELNVSVSTGSIEKCSDEEEAEDLLDAEGEKCSDDEEAEDLLDSEGESECHEALTAINYPGKRKLQF